MTPRKIMFVAGEASGDFNAAELVKVLGEQLPGSSFFGAGGQKMAEAGVELAFDMTAQSAVGLSDVLIKLPVFRRMFLELVRLAANRQPDVIILVDFGGFNRRFAAAIRNYVRSHASEIGAWNPRIVQYVSPQVWASRPGRAAKMAKDIDLLLCLFPFEKEWYAQRVPQLRVECVGHPLFDRHAQRGTASLPVAESRPDQPPRVVLLPGSRHAELRRHLPVIIAAAQIIATKTAVHFEMVLPNETLAAQARASGVASVPGLEIKIGGLSQALSTATIAVASTGTVTLECAYFGVPTVAIYKTSWSTYEIGRRIIKVRFLAMPNLLADRALFPELIQHDATGENIARESLALLNDAERRREVQEGLKEIMTSLGGPGAAERAAQAVIELLA